MDPTQSIREVESLICNTESATPIPKLDPNLNLGVEDSRDAPPPAYSPKDPNPEGQDDDSAEVTLEPKTGP